MNRQEAIKILKAYEVNGYGYWIQGGEEVGEALNLAISSLETDEAYQLEYESASDCKLEDDYFFNELQNVRKANTQLKKQIEMLKLDRDCEKSEVIPLDKVLEILGDYKLRIPPTVYYELKGDLVDCEEQGENT